MPSPSGGFSWNQATLSGRENQMLGALLQVFMLGAINQRLLSSGRIQATADDGAYGVQKTIEWAGIHFPDLNVVFDPDV